MQFEVVTLFPDMVMDAARHGVTGRALERGLWHLRCHNPRDFAHDAYRRVDDRPFGGGPGMVMLAEPLSACLRGLQARREQEGSAAARIIHLSPRGAPLTQARVKALSKEPALALLCGRYEAIDQRVLDRFVDEDISLGDFVVSGGEIPALALMDAVIRLLPGVMRDAESPLQDSFSDGLLEGPHYSRPEHFEGQAVPEVLLSGHHARIQRWRREQSLAVTADRRPDLIAKARSAGSLDTQDEVWLARYAASSSQESSVMANAQAATTQKSSP